MSVLEGKVALVTGASRGQPDKPPVVAYHDYTTAKSAFLGFSRNLAAEFGPQNITVNMIAGGLVDETDASAATTEEVRNIVADSTP